MSVSREEKEAPDKTVLRVPDPCYVILLMEVARAHGMKAHTSARSPSRVILYGAPDEVEAVVEAAGKLACDLQAKVIKALVEILEANDLKVPLGLVRLCSLSEARGVAAMPTAPPDDHSAAGSK